MSVHDDPKIEASSYNIGGAWMDRDQWALGVLHGIANHHQNRLMETGTWQLMARTINASNARGLSATAGETAVRVFSTAGRVLITYARRDDQISFLAYEHDDEDWWGGSIQSIEAPLSVVLAMIEDVASIPFELSTDQEVRIA